MRRIVAEECKPIPLGLLDENEATYVEFDVSGWEDTFGAGGEFSVWARRRDDPAYYPCTSVRDGDKVLWMVCSGDVSQVGMGNCGLIYQFADGGIAKSVVYSTHVAESVNGGGEVPEPWSDWVQAVLNAASGGSWDDIEGKPFERIGESLKVVDGTVEVNVYETANSAGGNTLVVG